MRKRTNIIVTTILSIAVFTGTITAKPQVVSDILESDKDILEQVAFETSASKKVESEAQSAEKSKIADSEKTSKSTSVSALPPRTRTQTPQVSRGGQSTKAVSTPSSSSTSSSSSQSSSKTSTSSSTKASAIIATAKNYIGVKYVWGGTTPSGFDCSGFTKYVFAKHGIDLPRVSRDQYTVGTAVSKANLKPGDLVFFSLDGDKVIDHVGIYVGQGQFINASSSKGVTIYTMGNYWNSKYIGAKRVL